MQTVFRFLSFSMNVLFPSWDATRVPHFTQSPRLLVCLAVDAFSVPPCFPPTNSVNRTSLVLCGPPLSSDLCDRFFPDWTGAVGSGNREVLFLSHRIGGLYHQHDLLLMILTLITWLTWDPRISPL